MKTNTDKLRRLRILQRLAFVTPNPMGETGLLREIMTCSDLDPTLELVRESIEYLSQCQLVLVIRGAGSPWLAAQITDAGMEWLADPSDIGFDIYSPGELPEPSLTNHRGRVSSISVLPFEVKAWLDQELVTRNFTDYRGIARLLAERGYEISKSSVGRYGRKVKGELNDLRQTIEIAKAFATEIGDDGAAMTQTLTALVQQELMTVVRDKTYDRDIKLPQLVQSIAQLSRSDINTREFQIKQAERKKTLVDAANMVVRSAKQNGVSDEAMQTIYQDVLHMK